MLNPPDIKRRLALACCRGNSQRSFVNEALVGPVKIYHEHYSRDVLKVGKASLGWQSFRNLRERLIRVGFVFEVDKYETITMTFPEETL